jgi:hypothetical protein
MASRSMSRRDTFIGQNMGNPTADDGSIERADFVGQNRQTIVPQGGTFTPKQLQGDPRPGAGSDEVVRGRGHRRRSRPGLLDAERCRQRRQGRLFRAGVEIPTGQTASNRADIELLYDGLPEPIDLELDLNSRVMYWNDRGDPPHGNTVNRAPMDSDVQARPAPRSSSRT